MQLEICFLFQLGIATPSGLTYQENVSSDPSGNLSTLDYFRTVNKSLIFQLYKQYHLDFKLFDYDPLPFLEVGL